MYVHGEIGECSQERGKEIMSKESTNGQTLEFDIRTHLSTITRSLYLENQEEVRG